MNLRLSQAPQTPETAGQPAVQFLFDGPRGRIAGQGAPVPVKRGMTSTLTSRISDAFANAPSDAIIGGALPFDRDMPDCLWLSRRDAPDLHAGTGDVPAAGCRVEAEPSARDYARLVAQALDLMRDGAGKPDALEKIVLARTLRVETPDDIAPMALVSRLAQDPAVTAFCVALPAGSDGNRWLCGGTPELLLEKTGPWIASHPLAGSAHRQPDAAEDRAAAEGLMRSGKDQREHAIVVEYIMDKLAPWCRELGTPDGTTLTSTRSMWHLGTRIRGRLRDPDTPSVVLAAMLHPTPAVCGVPMQLANTLIRQWEPVPREYYAGAVGWCDAAGDGAWHVAIRCAQIAGRSARLYAGAGIVPGSDPAAEAAETGAKFGALLAALGLPADAALPATQGEDC